ncbi:peptidase U32 family protein [Carboxylicivirga sp. M1479]|uniref:peptidase U32 family protein n=1 Tax=Carboxylicivirga sp. M1479 TaxID=2594476 RepID=UPI0011784404|nr:peptidase U32 family protein [Carboxylicivirga sp. M1479]TRX71678.1 U32 family peptidase [Carboxylicivirga sp. M1479]
MTQKIELLAPGGDIDAIKAAIASGANAVYCGLNKFNARNRAANITYDDLNGILRLAHQHQCQVFITLNIIIVESEIPDLIRLLNKLVNTSIDGIIIQDLGLFYILNKYYGSMMIHASTQMTTHNEGQIKFLSALKATRVNLSRELNMGEIKALTAEAHRHQLLTEVFVHGSYCISFSGLCYMSSLHGSNSANRGRCSQPCRDQYQTTSQGSEFPLNLKDNSAFENIAELAEAGVDSLKIEGRIKKYHYVYLVVEAYQKQLKRWYNNEALEPMDKMLYKVFNRNFTNGFLRGDIHQQMFIENPRDYSSTHLAKLNDDASVAGIERAEEQLYAEKGLLRREIKQKIDALSTCKGSLSLCLMGRVGEPLKIQVKTPEHSFELLSDVLLMNRGVKALDEKMLLSRFKAINDTEYSLDAIDLKQLMPNVFLPFKELTVLKNKLLYIIKNSRESHLAVPKPVLNKPKIEPGKPHLSVLVSTAEEVQELSDCEADLYFKLPNSMGASFDELLNLFNKYPQITPWFPAVLIGADYKTAVAFLQALKPQKLVCDNTGIAFEANKLACNWIAGPQLNIVNSYALLCLKESFNCSGAFISNEIKQHQIKNITRPDDFQLHYSIFHPIVLMSSRQCLFQQTVGCEKESMDDECMVTCDKSATLTNLKNTTFSIDKNRGEYHHIYHQNHFLNSTIHTDLPNTFSSFLIDLRNNPSETNKVADKKALVKLFTEHLKGDLSASHSLQEQLGTTTCIQYQNGL